MQEPNDHLQVGQVVKFAAPLSEDERGERFTVLELRGDRILVEYICDMMIRPTMVGGFKSEAQHPVQ